VERHRLDLSLPTTRSAGPIGVVFPEVESPGGGGRWTAEVGVVVDELGHVLDDSVQVHGAPSGRLADELRGLIRAWRFRPARVGSCWVPSKYLWRVSGRSDSGPWTVRLNEDELRFINADACREPVERHRLDPYLPTNRSAEPLGLVFPDVESADRGERWTAEVHFVVDELGHVIEESTQVFGAPNRRVADQLRESSRDWGFRPGWAGNCWVPSTYVWTIAGRRDSGPWPVLLNWDLLWSGAG
ncbi:MAG: hypothetical protein JSW71_07250, partial [Gemmatimonadota bacterium]